jgi:hypothetical protein
VATLHLHNEWRSTPNRGGGTRRHGQHTLALEGHFPIQLCYQFAHEWGHVLSNHRQSYNPGPFHWLKESICGGLSLVALKGAQASWSKSKNSVLRDPVNNIREYLQVTGENKLPLSIADIPQWFSINDQALRSVQTLQQLTMRLSVPISERICASPILIRSLQARNRWPSMDNCLEKHLQNWSAKCNAIGISCSFPKELAQLFGVQIS